MLMNSNRIILILALYLLVSISFFGNPSQSVSAEETTLPLPRFVSLRADKVNLRTGPGVQYPVEWVYQRQNLPVEIIAEYYTWRKIRDWQSTQGWIHQSMLSGRRTVVITGKQRTLRSSADAKSQPVAEIEAAAIVHLDNCPSGGGWCLVKAESLKGWLRKVEFWGAYRDEVLK
jgi:SH3-like domain-containing protein